MAPEASRLDQYFDDEEEEDFMMRIVHNSCNGVACNNVISCQPALEQFDVLTVRLFACLLHRSTQFTISHSTAVNHWTFCRYFNTPTQMHPRKCYRREPILYPERVNIADPMTFRNAGIANGRNCILVARNLRFATMRKKPVLAKHRYWRNLLDVG